MLGRVYFPVTSSRIRTYREILIHGKVRTYVRAIADLHILIILHIVVNTSIGWLPN